MHTTVHRSFYRALIFAIGALVTPMDEAMAQGQSPGAGCWQVVSPTGAVTFVCPPASSPAAGRWRGGEFIPACPAGMVFRRELGKCIPAQNYGGVIPCSEDDKTWDGRRWVPNCR
jgi:hypothetical protein